MSLSKGQSSISFQCVKLTQNRGGAFRECHGRLFAASPFGRTRKAMWKRSDICRKALGIEDDIAQKRARQQAHNDCANAEEPIPIQADKKREAAVALNHRLHGLYPYWKFDHGTVAVNCGAILASRPKLANGLTVAADQGQNRSLLSANTISDKSSVSPTIIIAFNARSDGGLPVTAS